MYPNIANHTNYIFHVDVNSAFLSWSAIKRLRDDPGSIDLRTIPSAVGGDVKTRHGIITAKSIPAKKYGIVTGEPVVKALQKCPKLVLVESDFTTYRECSRAFIEILNTYSPLVEQVSIDEAYVDITGTKLLYKNIETEEMPFPLCVAQKLKDEIRDTLGFTVNVGISSNKLLSKMASDFSKPDKIHTLFPEEIQEKMWPLPIDDLYGCGKATADRLRSIGIRTIGEAAKSDMNFLINILGENTGNYIHAAANGIGNSVVSVNYEDAKSYSNETTLSFDLTSGNYDTDIVPILKGLSGHVSRRLKRDQVYGKTITVSIKTADFKRHSCQMQLEDSTNDEGKIYEHAKRLADKLLLGEEGLFVKGAAIRLVGVGLSKLDDGSYRQMSLFDNYVPDDKRKKLDALEQQLQSAYGKDVIKKGVPLT